MAHAQPSSLVTSSKFAAAGASGTDWRDTSKSVLQQLESVKTEGAAFNVGFLYISDHLAQDAESILNLFRSVLEIQNWVGTVGVGVFSNSQRFVDEPAISALIGHIDEADFQIFNATQTERNNEQALRQFLGRNDPMLIFTHGDPMAEENPATALKRLEDFTSGFIVGGLSSSRHMHMQFASQITDNGLSGIVFSQHIPVASTLSQGCSIIGEIHTITRCDGHTIQELDSKPAADVFEQSLRSMAIKKIDRDPDTIMVDENLLKDPDNIPEEFKTIFKGEVLVGFPVSGSDQKEYLVRNIVSINDDGSMTISETIVQGDLMLFVHRDDQTVAEDLCKNLLDLRERVKKSHGEFKPKAAIYVSCLARAFSEPQSKTQMEIELIRDIIGDVPLTGFYAGGEINRARLYGYTGILTLFL
jgi:small ligand-binding sensory domain FIST